MFGDGGRPLSRRRVIAGLGSVAGMGSLRSSPYEDRDGDGIPDDLERSEAYHDYIEGIFGSEQFDGLEPDRPDLLIDARYVGSSTIDDRTKYYLEEQFREHGIHLQWLDYPKQYDHERFDERYGNRVERVLWPIRSFYSEEVEDILQDIALQVIVVPQIRRPLESLYTVHQGGSFEGVSFGNRSLVLEQESLEQETILVMHEIGHLVLCHTPDPRSVMSQSPQQAEFLPDEWDAMRGNLDNIRDATGFDVTMRRCLIDEYLEQVEDL